MFIKLLNVLFNVPVYLFHGILSPNHESEMVTVINNYLLVVPLFLLKHMVKVNSVRYTCKWVFLTYYTSYEYDIRDVLKLVLGRCCLLILFQIFSFSEIEFLENKFFAEVDHLYKVLNLPEVSSGWEVGSIFSTELQIIKFSDTTKSPNLVGTDAFCKSKIADLLHQFFGGGVFVTLAEHHMLDF